MGFGVDFEMDVAGGAVGGVAFVIVIEMNADDAFGIGFVPEWRGVFHACVDEMERVRGKGLGDEKKDEENAHA